MKRKLIIFISMTVLLTTFISASKSEKQYIQDLDSKDNKTVMEAASYLGKEQVKDSIDSIIRVLKTHTNTTVKIYLAAALGKMDVKGKPTTALKEVIMKEKSNSVIYAALLAIFNLKDASNNDARLAVQYCEKNKKDDIFIADIIKRIKKVIK